MSGIIGHSVANGYRDMQESLKTQLAQTHKGIVEEMNEQIEWKANQVLENETAGQHKLMDEFRNISNNVKKISSQQERMGLKVCKVEEDSEATRNNVETLQEQIKDFKEFDIKTFQAQIQFDLKDLGQEVTTLRQRFQSAPDREELEGHPISSTSEDRFRALTRQLQEYQQARWAAPIKKETADGQDPAISGQTLWHVERQSSNVVRDESLNVREHRTQSLAIGEDGVRTRRNT